jgi:hypothetical protein
MLLFWPDDSCVQRTAAYCGGDARRDGYDAGGGSPREVAALNRFKALEQALRIARRIEKAKSTCHGSSAARQANRDLGSR